MTQPKEKAIALTKKHIDGLKPVAIAQDPAVRNQFVTKFAQMYQVPVSEALRFYEREKDNFSRLISNNPSLAECTPMSIYMSFMRVGGWKLSFEDGPQGDVYLIPGNRKVGTTWVKELTATPSPYGEKKIRINNGQLKEVDEVQIVREGDFYEESLGINGKEVKWAKKHKEGAKIIGSFIRMVEASGRVKFVTFDLSDIAVWEAASLKKNTKYDEQGRIKGQPKANALYTSGPDGGINKGFLRGKSIKHAFIMYPRIELGAVKPDGFIPDTSEAIKLNSFIEDEFENAEYIEDADKVIRDEPTDEFTQEVQAEEPAKESVKIITNGDDDMFN